MQTTPHLIVGAAIGTQFHNPALVVTLATASHFVLDSIPHFGFFIAKGTVGMQYKVEDLSFKDINLVLADVLLGIVSLFFLTRNNPSAELMWLGAFCGFMPDLHHTLQILFDSENLKKYTNFHMKFHYKKPIKLLPGLATQTFVVLAAVLTILRLR